MSNSSLEKSKGYVPLSYCVRMVQMDLSDYTESQYEKYLQYAIRGFEKLNFGTFESIEVAYLPISDINTVDLPSDYINYYKIGIEVGNQIWVLGLNNNILLPRGIDQGEDARELFAGTPSNATGGYRFTDHYVNGQFVGGLYGVGGGFRQSHYRIDTSRQQIVFDDAIPRTRIVLEYKSNGISGQTLVPRIAIDCIVAYIHWVRLRGKNRLPERREAEREWKEELSELRSYVYAFNATEYLDMLHAEQVQTPKR